MPLSPSEHASVAARARWSRLNTPEKRQKATTPGRVQLAVNTLVDNWPELRPDQIARLQALLQPVEGGGADVR